MAGLGDRDEAVVVRLEASGDESKGDEIGLPRDRRLASITLELDVDEVASIEASFWSWALVAGCPVATVLHAECVMNSEA